MKLRTLPGFFFLSLLVAGLVFGGASLTPAAALQTENSSPTPTGGGKPFITVTYEEPIHVRAGPNSVYYPVVGSLPIGAVADAIGRSPAGEWIKISFPAASDGSGVGWVYAPLVTLTPGFLPIVQPPPTAVPVNAPTLDPNFVASLQPAPTSTRLPTFTAPPPLVVPTYENPIQAGAGISSGMVVLILGVVGLAGLLIASIRGGR
jgi:hypothetical protein